MKIFKNIIPLFIFTSVLFVLPSCVDQDFDEPEAWEIPEGEVLTIAELRDLYMDSPVLFEDHHSVYAVVTMDDKNGNIYRNAFVQDATGAINLRMVAPGGIYEGDSVRISLKGTKLSAYQGMLQLDNVNADRNIKKLDVNVELEPMLITIDEIENYQAHLVKLENVQFAAADTGLPFADSENLQAVNRMLEDCEGNEVIVRTSGYAVFADEPVPSGNGTIIGIVSEFQSDMQLFIRRMNEVNLDGERCNGDDDDDDNGDDDNGEPVTFIDEDFSGFANYDDIEGNGWTSIAEVGDRKWICRTFEGNHFAQATSYNASASENIMWMITPPVNLDAINNPVLEFQSAQTHYTHDGFGVYISADFDGTNLEAATWDPLPATLAGQDDPQYDWIDSGKIELGNFNGTIYIAWRYQGSDPAGETGTFRVDNVQLYDDN